MDPEAEDYDARRKIHILGTGSVGKLVAHSLIGINNAPPVNVIFHRPTYYEAFAEASNSISLTTKGDTETRSGFTAELSNNQSDIREQYPSYISNETIYNLVVSVKAAATSNALSALKHRLRPDSTILFLQNGMGVVEEVNKRVWPDPETRPNYMLGINSHGIYATGVAGAVHAGFGTIYLGLVPRVPFTELARVDSEDAGEDTRTVWHPAAKYLLRVMNAAPVLGAVALTPTELLQAQIEKLAVNCIINPLTVLMDCHNGKLLHNFSFTRVMRLLLAEISLVARSLPELKGVPGVEDRFSPSRLEKITVNVATKTAENISSMLQDARRGVETEVDYINGYIVKRGEEMGLKPIANYMLTHQVKGKQMLINHERDGYSPFAYKL